jgi:predicted helicase
MSTKQQNKNLAQVFHFDLYGKRKEKYDFLLNNSLQSVEWQELEFNDDNYFFVPKDFSLRDEYEKGFKVDKLFIEKVPGIETIRDAITIHFEESTLKNTVSDFLNLSENELAHKYNTQNARDWKISRAKEDVKANINNVNAWQTIQYRPFDFRKTFYSGKQNGFICNGRYNVMKHLLKDNLGLIIPRQTTQDWRHIFIINKIFDGNITASAKLFGTGNAFPLYLYPDNQEQKLINEETERVPNLNKEIVAEIEKGLGITIEPLELLDYIYAVLHSPSYRERYKEFLKIDFPRIPFPKNTGQFWELVEWGSRLRRLHLLEEVEIPKGMAEYPIAGSNEVEKPEFLVSPLAEGIIGRVYINDRQYFDNVPTIAWNFYIGGYQPAQKWLKDRKGRTLNYEDILHYRKIIAVLATTNEIMKQIENVKFITNKSI